MKLLNTKKDENVSENGPIEADKAFSEIQEEPYKLPNDFKWEEINLESDLEVLFTPFL